MAPSTSKLSTLLASAIAIFAVQAVHAVPTATAVPTTYHGSRPAPTPAGRLSREGTRIMDDRPNMPYDPNTNPACTWWWDNDGSISCADMPREWGISRDDFLAWNPSINSDCTNYLTGRSYCVEAPSSPPPGSTSSTSNGPGTTTSPGNGIETPLPTQPGMVDNCDRFYFVQQDESCTVIASRNGISLNDLVRWNPSILSDCRGLWANVNVCVRVIGHSASSTSSSSSSSTTKPSSTTSAGNGIETPLPTQPSMVQNCNKFYFVKQDDDCTAIAASQGISQAQFRSWNPSVQSDCSGLWANVYACVWVIGTPTSSSTTTTTRVSSTTSAGNGIATPTPTQPGMVKNCDRFHFVTSGENCASIGARYGVTAGRIQQWNGLNSQCSGLWANAHVCVRTIGFQVGTSLSCGTTAKEWGGNKQAALDSVGSWCNGDSSTDGSGAFSTAQTKSGCYNAALGTNRFEFRARNDFGAAATLSVTRCNELIKAQINGCPRGGTGVSEGWWFSAVVVAGTC